MTVSATKKAATKKKAKNGKPAADFPLFIHKGTGRWCKKVKSTFHYFGKVADDPKGETAALRWAEEKDDIFAGRKPRAKREGYTSVREMCNKFLHAKKGLVESGERSQRTWDDYKEVCERMVAEFGASRDAADVRVEEFDAFRVKLAKQYGAERLAIQIQKVRTVYKYGFAAGLLDKPILFGPTFVRPGAKTMRLVRKNRGSRMFEAGDIRAMIDAAGVQLRAMILLGINCAYGNADVGVLQMSDIDLDRGWAFLPRGKTGVDRRAKLWPETVDAIRAAIAARPEPKSDEFKDLVFLTYRGASWAKGTKDNPRHQRNEESSKEAGAASRRAGLLRPAPRV
jgi:integrase